MLETALVTASFNIARDAWSGATTAGTAANAVPMIPEHLLELLSAEPRIICFEFSKSRTAFTPVICQRCSG